MNSFDHQLLSVLLKTTPDRVFFKDAAGNFIFANEAVVANMGFQSLSEILGKSDFDFFAHEHASVARADEERVLATNQPMVGKVEREVLRDGRTAWVSTTKVPLRDAQGRVVGICGISRDITELYNKEEKLRSYARDLAQKQVQLDQELTLAREVQQALLRGTLQGSGEWAFAHRYLPIGPVGGDFFSILPIGKHQVGLLICDVMGHGVSAALITVVQRILVDELQRFATEPGVFLREMNRRLCQIFGQASHPFYVTACYALLDAQSAKMRYALAAHPAPVHIEKKSGLVSELPAPAGPPPGALGMAMEIDYPCAEVRLEKGDRLLFYTDGLLDLDLDSGQNWDKPDLLRVVDSSLGVPESGFLDAIQEAVRSQSPRRRFLDDVCLVSVEYRDGVI
ncbi:MAG: SpoIIE family protein phosphatase [Verrucomicrobium sp.]|nr:SpoIIE family protein phosphatase [Verrucomicrobium sp.]